MEQKEESITVKKHTMWQVGTFLFATLFVVSLFTGGFGMKESSDSTITGGAVGVPTQPNNQPTPEPSKVQVSVDDDAVLGNKDAKVTIVEFSDYECPYCGRHFSETYPQIKKDYIDTGKVKIVFRDFPLSFHPNAQPAAEASECADEQGKFWEYHDALYQNQQILGSALYTQLAEQLGLDVQKFQQCIDSGRYRQEVQDDFAYGSQIGVSGTPTFFINGIGLVGAQPYEAFKQVIEAELVG